jgi:hypothetical protein
MFWQPCVREEFHHAGYPLGRAEVRVRAPHDRRDGHAAEGNAIEISFQAACLNGIESRFVRDLRVRPIERAKVKPPYYLDAFRSIVTHFSLQLQQYALNA